MGVRQANLTDAREIALVHIVSWQAAYRGIFPDSLLDNLSVDRRETFWKTVLAEGNFDVLVFEKKHQINGFATFGVSRDDDVDHSKVGEIYSIYLDPLEWKKGVGSILAKEAIQALKVQGYSVVTLWVLNENERAIRFYKKMGFVPDGAEKVETWKDDIKLIEVRYRRNV